MNGHSSAAILSIGDELALGQKPDTNSQWLSERLLALGIVVREHATIADDLTQHVAALRRLAAAHPLVISTGGLGPTADDLTRQALAEVMGEELIEDADALEQVRAVMTRRGRELTALQRTQALRPGSARCLGNEMGTAPGIHGVIRMGATADSLEDSVAGRGARATCDVYCLPGPPGEMRAMFDRWVAPELKPVAGRAVRTKVLHCLGIGEGDLAARLGGLMDRGRNPAVGTTASGAVVSVRIRYEGDACGAEAAMAETERAARAAGGAFVFGEEDQTIQRVVLDCLKIRGERLVVAESCTGGGLGALFTETPGASDALVGGWITYSNEMKAAMLGVPGTMFARHGAVSAEVAAAMAVGALRAAAGAGGARHALAITGIAGPGGGSEAKPVGTVFISRASANPGRDVDVEVRRFLITGDRDDIRDRSANLALMMLRFHLLSLDVPRTLWQIGLDGSAFPRG